VKTKEVSSNITFDSATSLSSFLLNLTTSSQIYPLFECKKVDSTRIVCIGYNIQTSGFDTLAGYLSPQGALDVSNRTNTIQMRAAFKQNGWGQGVVLTSTTTYYTEMSISNLVNDSIFESTIDSVETIVNKLNSIEYQVTFPLFTHNSASKIAIFTQFRNLSLQFLKAYTDSLQPQNTHFVSFKSKCKKIGNAVWSYSWYRDSDSKTSLPLFGMSFVDSTSQLLTSESIVQSLDPMKLQQFQSEVMKSHSKKDSIFPQSNYIEVTEKAMYLYRIHQKPIKIEHSMLNYYVGNTSFYAHLVNSLLKN
jgi:hypothetical protein